ncbi:hypothetical protein SNE40_019649 [Patella caerulea]|uniref:Uncharacterized protein n=1 Tax=Patella caerulea TaxID=87958 RepID=A0AAN8PAP8_PATCE
MLRIFSFASIRKKKREKKQSNVPLEHINPGFTDDESDYGNHTIHNNKNTISDENGHYAVVPGVYDSPIAKVQPLPRDDFAEDNQANHDDLVTDHYTLVDIVTPKPTKQQNVTIGEMGKNKSISSIMNPTHKSKRQPILPVDVKDLYAVVNKPVREASHESEQSQEGIHLYAVPNKPKKQQVGDSDTTESRDAIENKLTTEDNKSTLHVNDNTNTHQETSAMETDIPLNSATDPCTVESTALLEGVTRL